MNVRFNPRFATWTQGPFDAHSEAAAYQGRYLDPAQSNVIDTTAEVISSEPARASQGNPVLARPASQDETKKLGIMPRAAFAAGSIMMSGCGVRDCLTSREAEMLAELPGGVGGILWETMSFNGPHWSLHMFGVLFWAIGAMVAIGAYGRSVEIAARNQRATKWQDRLWPIHLPVRLKWRVEAKIEKNEINAAHGAAKRAISPGMSDELKANTDFLFQGTSHDSKGVRSAAYRGLNRALRRAGFSAEEKLSYISALLKQQVSGKYPEGSFTAWTTVRTETWSGDMASQIADGAVEVLKRAGRTEPSLKILRYLTTKNGYAPTVDQFVQIIQCFQKYDDAYRAARHGLKNVKGKEAKLPYILALLDHAAADGASLDQLFSVLRHVHMSKYEWTAKESEQIAEKAFTLIESGKAQTLVMTILQDLMKGGFVPTADQMVKLVELTVSNVSVVRKKARVVISQALSVMGVHEIAKSVVAAAFVDAVKKVPDFRVGCDSVEKWLKLFSRVFGAMAWSGGVTELVQQINELSSQRAWRSSYLGLRMMGEMIPHMPSIDFLSTVEQLSRISRDDLETGKAIMQVLERIAVRLGEAGARRNDVLRLSVIQDISERLVELPNSVELSPSTLEAFGNVASRMLVSEVAGLANDIVGSYFDKMDWSTSERAVLLIGALEPNMTTEALVGVLKWPAYTGEATSKWVKDVAKVMTGILDKLVGVEGRVEFIADSLANDHSEVRAAMQSYVFDSETRFTQDELAKLVERIGRDVLPKKQSYYISLLPALISRIEDEALHSRFRSYFINPLESDNADTRVAAILALTNVSRDMNSRQDAAERFLAMLRIETSDDVRKSLRKALASLAISLGRDNPVRSQIMQRFDRDLDSTKPARRMRWQKAIAKIAGETSEAAERYDFMVRIIETLGDESAEVRENAAKQLVALTKKDIPTQSILGELARIVSDETGDISDDMKKAALQVLAKGRFLEM